MILGRRMDLLSFSGVVSMVIGIEAGPRPAGVLAAAVMLISTNLGAPA